MNYNKFIELIQEDKRMWGNNKSQLHGLPYWSNDDINFIHLISLSPDINIINDDKIGKSIINKGKYFNFIISAFNNYIENCNIDIHQCFNRFFNEDYDKYKKALIKFNENNGDINKLKTFGNLLKLTSENPDNNYYDNWLELKPKLKENVDYIFVYEDDKWFIIIPLEHDNYLKLCDKSEYCTRLFKYFYNYTVNYNDPLYLIIPKNPKEINELYQIHVNDNQFKDVYDNEVDRENYKIGDKLMFNWIKKWNSNLKKNNKWKKYTSNITLNGFEKSTKKQLNQYFIENHLINRISLKLKNNKLYINILEINQINQNYYDYINEIISLSNIEKSDVYITLQDDVLDLKYQIGYNENNLNILIKRNFTIDEYIVNTLNNKYDNAKITNINNINFNKFFQKINYEHNDLIYPELLKYLIINNFLKQQYKNELLLIIGNKKIINESIIKILLDNGADINYQNAHNYTILTHALMKKNINLIKILLDNGANINYTVHNYSKTAFALALKTNDDNIIELILNKIKDVNYKYEDGNTPLLITSNYNYPKAIQFLLNKGANINDKNSFGMTSLINSSIHGYTENVELLLNSKAEIDIQDKDSYTALMFACRYNFIEIVKLLLKFKANPNLLHNSGNTALMMSNNLIIVELLLDNSADPNIINYHNKTALDLARDEKIKDLLISKGAKYGNEIKENKLILNFDKWQRI